MHVVSAITATLTSRARDFLARSGFPPAQLHFRRWMIQWSPENFRYARIEHLLSIHGGRRFVFVFDNSPTSVRLSRRLLEGHPSRVAAVYLRETVKVDLPAGVVPFITAFDIAENEFVAGRISAADTAQVAEAILAQADPDKVIPGYSHCPRALPPCPVGDVEVARQCERVRAQVLAICAARSRRGA